MVQFNTIPRNQDGWDSVLRDISINMHKFIESKQVKNAVDRLKMQLSTTKINGFKVTSLDPISGHLIINKNCTIFIKFESPKMWLTHIYGVSLHNLIHDVSFMDFFRLATVTRSQFNELCDLIDVELCLTIEKNLTNYNSTCELVTKPWSTIKSWIDPTKRQLHQWLDNNQSFVFRCLEFYQIKFEFIEYIKLIDEYVSNNHHEIKNSIVNFQHDSMLKDMEEIIGRAIAAGMDESKIRDLIDLAIVKTIQES